MTHRRSIILAVLLPPAALATWNVWTGYSLWLDEVYSVAISSASWGTMFEAVLSDVHPPLYQVLLKLWVGLFGNGEVAARSLSLLFAGLTLGVSRQLLKGKSVVFAASFVGYLGSSWLFSFYAQEVRSYAALLFLATLTLFAFEQRNARSGGQRAQWYGVLVATSLVHYFGLIYAGLFLIVDLLSLRKPRLIVERVAVGALMWVWPAIHVAFGTVTGRAGGDFWIDASGPVGIFKMASHVLSGGLTVAVGEVIAPSWALAWTVPTLIAAALLAWAFVRFDVVRTRPVARACLVVLVATVGTVVALDVYTPVATLRNLVVLLPLGAYLVACALDAVWDASARRAGRGAVVGVGAAYFVACLAIGLHFMDDRWTPRQNWKAMAEAVQRHDLCAPQCVFTGGGMKAIPHMERLYAYYFDEAMGDAPRRATRMPERLISSPEESSIIAIHTSERTRRALVTRYDGRRCLEPTQSWEGSVFILTSNRDAVDGLKECTF